jgi:acyl-CoA thioesterase-2
VTLFDLEQLEVDIFRGVSPEVSLQRVFGGQVAGQALIAAGRTVNPERRVHSLHSYFLRPGDPSIPIVYTVERVRDGRSFSTRRVVAIQHGKPIFFLSASFQIEEPGLDHQEMMPTVAAPLTLPTLGDRLRQVSPKWEAFARLDRPIDLRYVEDPVWLAGGGPDAEGVLPSAEGDLPSPDPSEPERTESGSSVPERTERGQRVWMRVDGTLPDDPLLHVCALTYASDLTLLEVVLDPHRVSLRSDGFVGPSLDHAVWFHRPFRADEWFLYDCRSPSASGARGLATGRFFAADGRQLATVVQEGLVRT